MNGEEDREHKAVDGVYEPEDHDEDEG